MLCSSDMAGASLYRAEVSVPVLVFLRSLVQAVGGGGDVNEDDDGSQRFLQNLVLHWLLDPDSPQLARARAWARAQGLEHLEIAGESEAAQQAGASAPP